MIYFVEITDVYGGEANYSWVTRHKVKARSMVSAMRRISRSSGLNWRKVTHYGDGARYDSKSGATCAFISEWSDDEHGELMHVQTGLAE